MKKLLLILLCIIINNKVSGQIFCEVEIDGDSITCLYNTVQVLEASPSALSSTFNSYVWYSPGSPSVLANGNQLTINNAGEYCVIAMDTVNLCLDTACIIISQKEINIYTAPSPPIICLGDSIVLEIDTAGLSNIIWVPNTLITPPVHRIVDFPTISSTYVVEAIDSLGCDRRGEVIVYVDSCVTEINEFPDINKKLTLIVDYLGRETKEKKNQPLFYIYDDGTVEKRIVIE